MGGGNKQQQQACIQCAGVSFSKDEFGFLECDICHTRVEGYFTQEVEQFESGGGYKTGSYKRVLTQDILNAMNQKKLQQKDNRYYILQNLLKIQVTSLIKDHGYNEQLYQVTGELWFTLLDRFSQDGGGGGGGGNNDDNNSKENNHFGIINYPPPFITLSICYLACVYLKEPVIVSDFIQLAQTGKIPSFTNEITWSFSWSNSNSTFTNFERICVDLCKYLNFLPSSNVPLILLRFCTELKLPKQILNLSHQLYNIISIPFQVYKKKYPDNHLLNSYEKIILPTNSDLLCVSIIMIVLKMKLHLFDRQYTFNNSSGIKSDSNADTDINSTCGNGMDNLESLEFLQNLLNEKRNNINIKPEQLKKEHKDNEDSYQEDEEEEKEDDDDDEEINEELEKVEIENWLYDIMYNLPKDSFNSKQDTWSLNISDFKGIPKLKPSNIKRLITDQIHTKYDGLSERYQKNHSKSTKTTNQHTTTATNNNNHSTILFNDNEQQSTSSSKKVKKTILLPKVRTARSKSSNGNVNGLDYYFWLISILQKITNRQHKEINLFLNKVEQIYLNQISNLSSPSDGDNKYSFKLKEDIPIDKVFKNKKTKREKKKNK